VHLREDRRHIQDHDVERMAEVLTTKLNLEMATSEGILALACRLRPADVCLVPEKREELTTEGGLAVAGHEARIGEIVARLGEAGVRVSLFIEPDRREIEAARAVGAPVIEIHTGAYALAAGAERGSRLAEIADAARLAAELGLAVNGGHGLTLDNVAAIAAIPAMEELNIGHSIVARALFVGMEEAAREMLAVCRQARGAGEPG
jgi:pyridoxine 5-phosphate synthase